MAALVGWALIALVLFWLAENFFRHRELFTYTLLIGITNGAVYALVALGYTLVYGILELINFAHGDVFMLGAMISYWFIVQVFHVGANPSAGTLVEAIVLTMLVVMVVCAIINMTVERIAYRPLRHAPRLAPLITAIAASFILENIALSRTGAGYEALTQSPLPSGQIVSLGGNSYTWGQLIVVLITLPVLVGLIWLVQYTRRGKAMRATAQDREAAAMMGINVNRTISFTFAIAGALAGAAGLVWMLYNTTIRYDSGFRLGLIAFTAAVVGGIGNLTGAVLGGLVIGLIESFNNGLIWHSPGGDWTESIVFTILILILVFRPSGLLGERTPEGG